MLCFSANADFEVCTGLHTYASTISQVHINVDAKLNMADLPKFIYRSTPLAMFQLSVIWFAYSQDLLQLQLLPCRGGPAFVSVHFVATTMVCGLTVTRDDKLG
jgi:hypothetical protein